MNVSIGTSTPAHALLDSGLLSDFLSLTLADQLNVNRIKLNVPLGLQLTVQGSRSKINSGAKVKFEYQNIVEEWYLDIINLSNYDIILGMLWMYQHQICDGFNPPHVLIGCDNAKPILGSAVADMSSHAVSLGDDHLELRPCVLSGLRSETLTRALGIGRSLTRPTPSLSFY